MPVFCLGEFVRVVTHPRILDPPSTLEQAWAALEGLLQSPTSRVLNPGGQYPSLYRDALKAREHIYGPEHPRVASVLYSMAKAQRAAGDLGGAKESLAQAGYSMHAVLTIRQLLDYWEETGKVEKDKIEETRLFLQNSG